MVCISLTHQFMLRLEDLEFKTGMLNHKERRWILRLIESEIQRRRKYLERLIEKKDMKTVKGTPYSIAIKTVQKQIILAETCKEKLVLLQ